MGISNILSGVELATGLIGGVFSLFGGGKPVEIYRDSGVALNEFGMPKNFFNSSDGLENLPLSITDHFSFEKELNR